ncbi:MAG TPA: MASE1 domain-containing protein, partial [Allosphingosinicella sp.]
MARPLLHGFLLFLLYLPLAVLGLQWARVGGAGTAVWPAFGVALACLLLWGPRIWPAIFAGRLLAGILTGSEQPLWAEVAIAAVNAGADLLGALILQKYAGINLRLRTRRDILWLAFAIAVAAAVSATLGTAVIAASSGLSAGAATDVWAAWWSGNMVAGLTLTPLILSWSKGESFAFDGQRWLHLALCLAAVASLSWLVFEPDVLPWLRSWHLFPVLIWAALGFNVRGASAALLITASFALWGLSAGEGPLIHPGLDPVLTTQQFVALSALTILLLAAISDERRSIEP